MPPAPNRRGAPKAHTGLLAGQQLDFLLGPPLYIGKVLQRVIYTFRVSKLRDFFEREIKLKMAMVKDTFNKQKQFLIMGVNYRLKTRMVKTLIFHGVGIYIQLRCVDSPIG